MYITVSDAQSSVSVSGLAPPANDVSTEAKTQSSDVDCRFYTEMMDCVPHESVSVPLIMHCMLEQVSIDWVSCIPLFYLHIDRMQVVCIPHNLKWVTWDILIFTCSGAMMQMWAFFTVQQRYGND